MPTIKLYASLRTFAGTKELTITPPARMLRSASRGVSLGDVLIELGEQVPSLDGLILEYGHIRPHFVITINGYNATDLSTAINEEDIIAIFPPIAGG